MVSGVDDCEDSAYALALLTHIWRCREESARPAMFGNGKLSN
jgi:hypothetical protein